jgi:hypothetical protein
LLQHLKEHRDLGECAVLREQEGVPLCLS